MVVKRGLTRGGARDLPLTFGLLPDSFGLTDQLVARFGLEKAFRSQDERALLHLVAEGVLAAQADQDVSYSRHKPFYTRLQRYYGNEFTYRRIVRCMDLGVQHGLFAGHKAASADHRRTGLQSTFRASDALVELCQGIEFTRVKRELIRLKDEQERLMPYLETSDTIRWRRELETINKFLETVEIGLPPSVDRMGPFVVTDEGPRLFEPVQLHRVFNRGSFDYGGRAYGWHQNLPKDVRRQMTLNGQPVAELDFKAFHPTILLAERGIQRVRDPYEYDIYSRYMWKNAVLMAINCKNAHQAVAKIQELRQVSDHCIDECWFFLRLIKRVNHEFADALCSDAGIRLMKIDSEIIIDAIDTLVEIDIPCLPVHDSIIAPEEHKDIVADVMRAAFTRRFPGLTAEVR